MKNLNNISPKIGRKLFKSQLFKHGEEINLKISLQLITIKILVQARTVSRMKKNVISNYAVSLPIN